MGTRTASRASRTTPERHGEKEAGLTKETLSKVITEYVKKDTQLKGGYFLFYDQKTEKPLSLSLIKVHYDRLAMVRKGLYFACADFKTPDGRLYDIDIFMQESETGLEVSEISIHKEDGKARYSWSEEKGIWKRK